jgi:hypothetical protein
MSSGQEVGEIFGEGIGPATSLLRSPTVLIASVGLFGMNIYLFRFIGLDYKRILTLDLEKDALNQHHLKRSSNGPQSGHSSNNSLVDDDEDFIENVSTSSQGSITSTSDITASKLLILSCFLMLLLHSISLIWVDICERSPIEAIFIFYGFIFLGLVIPFKSTEWIRKAFSYVLGRIFELLHPRCSYFSSRECPRPIPFMDVFVADGMCSLSKVFFDWGMLWHLASHYPDPVPASAHSIIIPSICASWPYICRARQCLIMHTVGVFKNDPKRYQHVLNAIKYSTSLFPLIVSAYQKTVDNETATSLDIFLIILLTINSLYSLAWDIIMDWGMMQNPMAVAEYTSGQCSGYRVNGAGANDTAVTCGQAVLRPKLRYGFSLSLTILISDAILRFSWALRFVEKDVFPSNDAFILCTQFLEVFRRGIWNLLRVEWEHMKQIAKVKKGISYDTEEMVSLADSSMK